MTLFVTLDLVRRECRTVATPALHSRHAERLYATTLYVGALIEKIIYICSSKTPSSRYLSGLKKGDKKPCFPLIFVKIRRETVKAPAVRHLMGPALPVVVKKQNHPALCLMASRRFNLASSSAVISSVAHDLRHVSNL
jgi:hypothetical protein